MGMFAGIWILLAALHVQGKTTTNRPPLPLPPPPNPFLPRAITHSLKVFVFRVFRAKCVNIAPVLIEKKEEKKKYSQQLHLNLNTNGCTNTHWASHTHTQTIWLTLPLQQVDGDIYANRVEALHHIPQVVSPLSRLLFPISHFNCNSGRTECYCMIIEKPVASLFSAIVYGQSLNIVRD